MGEVETISEIVFFIVMISFLIAIIFFGRYSEKKKWNNGICPNCGSSLILNPWMRDSQGGRGWTCPETDCDYTAWISYNVDIKPINERNES